jgi:hypothetical protein
LHTIKPKQGVVFQQGVFGVLNPDGVRVQMVYRATDLGGTGEPEVLTEFRWLPKGKVQNATYKRLVVEVGHTNVVPDYTIDLWSAFPKYPNSGLVTTFAANPKIGEKPHRIVDSSYTVRPQDVRADGYVSYPRPQSSFIYNGFNSLLLDFKMDPTSNMTTGNGQEIQLMVLSMARPNSRVHASGKLGVLVNPHTATQGRGDNSLSYMQFEFARNRSQALSPWRKSPVANPDYHTPLVASALYTGTQIGVLYRGADSASGAGVGPWSMTVDVADGKPFIQYQITFVANPWTGAVPSLESIVIPIN